MRRSGAMKFPNSVQLFKFCQKVLADRKGGKVHDQEVGSILSFNPSDCSHWKRGEKNVKSVFALAKLAEELGVEISLIHDLASGHIGLAEAYFEYKESNLFSKISDQLSSADRSQVDTIRVRINEFVSELHEKAEFSTPPLYLPEVLRFFTFLTTQPVDMMDRLSRILRVKPGQYTIQFAKGELKPQTRMSIVKDLARIVFEGERSDFPQLGQAIAGLENFEKLLFIAEVLAPKKLMLKELRRLDSRKNIVSEISTTFWAPSSLVSFQMQDIVRLGRDSGYEKEIGLEPLLKESKNFFSPSI